MGVPNIHFDVVGAFLLILVFLLITVGPLLFVFGSITYMVIKEWKPQRRRSNGRGFEVVAKSRPATEVENPSRST